jgi:26S proteasome regulatory subunit T3
LVDILPPEADSSISLLGEHERPDVSYSDIGGYDIQKQEIREAVELPLTHAGLYAQLGIDPPRGGFWDADATRALKLQGQQAVEESQ